MVNEGERWIDAEIEFLRSNIHQGLDHCARKLGRSISAIRKRAYKLNLISNPPQLYTPYRPGNRKEWRERAKQCFT